MLRHLFSSWYFSLILTVILILGLWFLVSDGNLYQSAYYGKLFGSHSLWLAAGSEVKQEFVASYPGLDQVDIFVENLNPAVAAELTFQLRESCQAQSNLRRQVALQPQGEIDGQTFYTFSFDPLEESTAQKYCFILSANTKSDEQVIGVLAGEGNVYPDGQAYYQASLFGKKPDKSSALQPSPAGNIRVYLPIIRAEPPREENLDVAFQLHYHGSRFKTSQIFFERLTEYKSYGWANPELYGLFFIVYLFCVIVFIRFVVKLEK